LLRIPFFVVVVALVCLGSASPVRAASVQLQDIFDPADVLFSKDSAGICVGDNGTDTVSGQDAGCFSLLYSIALTPDSLISASLDLYLRDDDDRGHNPEAVRVTLDGNLAGEYLVIDSPFKFDVLANISADGLLSVFLERGSQGQGQSDFYFDKSILNAEWEEGGTDTEVDTIPEPTMLLLMGAGVAGAAFNRQIRRRRRID
jgi:phosphoribulokinase